MLQTLILNIAIVLAVCFVSFEAKDPLALLALTLMLPLPQGTPQHGFFPMPGGMDDDDESKPIGFTADIS